MRSHIYFLLPLTVILVAQNLFAADTLANPVSLRVTAPNATSLNYEILNCDTLRLDTVIIIVHTDSMTVVNGYKTLPSENRISRSTIAQCGTYSVSSLSPGVKYYLGAAVCDRYGNWSGGANIFSQYTRLNNVLTIAAQETPDPCDSTIAITVGGLAGAGSGVDSVKVYYSTSGYITDPTSLQPNQAVSASYVLSGGTVNIGHLLGSWNYFFTVTFKDNENSNGWALINQASNSTVFTTAAYGQACSAPLNPLSVHMDAIEPTRAVFSLQAQGAIENKVQWIYLYITTDSASLAAGYQGQTPWAAVGPANVGPFSVDTLHDMTVYYFGVALKDSIGLFSPLSVTRVSTAVPPANSLVFDSLRSGGDFGLNANRVYVYWRWTGSPLPAAIRLMYKTYASAADTPTAYNDPAFTQSNLIVPAATSGMDSITETQGIHFNSLYTVAAYIQDSRGVWAVHDTRDTVRTLTYATSLPNTPLVFAYDPATSSVTCTVRPDATSDLSLIRWGTVAGVYANSLPYVAAQGYATFTVPNPDTVFVRLENAFSNSYETRWYHFIDQQIALLSYSAASDTTFRLDNNLVEMTFSPASLISTSYKNLMTVFVGRSEITLADQGLLSGQGINGIAGAKYWFMTRFGGSGIAALYSADPGLGLCLHFNPSVNAYNDSLKVFRIFTDNTVECLGGKAVYVNANDAYVALSGFAMDDFWKAGDGQASPTAQDTFMLVCGIDRTPPEIVAASTSFENAGWVHVGVNDNTVNMDVRLKVSTFLGNGQAIDTVCVNTKKFTNLSGGRATSINMDYFVGDWIGRYMSDIAVRGMYCAVAVGDGSFRRSWFMSPQLAVDSATGVFQNLMNNWQIVGLPCSLAVNEFAASQRDIMNNIPGFSKGYDRQRLRLLRLSANSFSEYAANDTGFFADRNQAFLMITRYDNDKNVGFKTGSAVHRGINDSRGYIAGTAAGLGAGWHLLSLPFRGFVKQSALERMSVHDPGHSAFQGRMWRLDKTFVPIGSDESMPTGGKGFLVYLFNGDTVIAPVTDDSLYLPPAGMAVAKAVEGSWTLSFSVSSNGEVVDGLNEFGEGHAMELPDLVFPGAPFICGFKGAGKGLMSVVRRPPAKENAGEWEYVVENTGAADADIELSFSGLADLPSGYGVYVEDARGYGQLVPAAGAVSCYVKAHESAALRIVAGNSEYVRKNIVRQAPAVFSLDQNYPNPFNPTTTIQCAVPRFGGRVAGSVLDVAVYDIQGRLVKRIAAVAAEPGCHRFTWRAQDVNGVAVGSGLYAYRMSVRDGTGKERYAQTKKMLLLR